MLLPKRSLAVLALGVFALLQPASAQEPRKDPPKVAPQAPAVPFPLPDIDKVLPPGLDRAQIQQIRKQMEMTRKLLENLKLNQQLPGGVPLPPGAAFAPAFPFTPANANRLGVSLKQPSDVLVEQLDLPKGKGLVLSNVAANSAAAKAGLKNHDILLELGGKAVSSQVDDFVKALNEFKTGNKVDVVVLRKGKKETIQGVTLPDVPQNNPLQIRFPGGLPNLPGGLPNLPGGIPNLPRGAPILPGVQGGNNQAPGQNRIVVADGQPEAVPTAYSGAVRIRVVPPRQPQAGLVKPLPAGEVRFTLDVAAEPRLQGLKIVGPPRINKAIDDQGQDLHQIVEPQAQANANPFGNRIIINGGFGNFNGWANTLGANVQQTEVHLKLGQKAAKSVKEMTGTQAIEVLLPAEPLVSVDNVLKAAGQTAKGKDGSAMELQAIEKLANGSYQVKVKVDTAVDGNNPFAVLGGGVVQMQQIRIQVNGNNVIMGGVGGGGNSGDTPALVDAKGKAFKLVGVPSSATNVNGNAQTRSLTLHFEAEAGQGEPARLVLNGRRRETVQVPFTLRNVPLP